MKEDRCCQGLKRTVIVGLSPCAFDPRRVDVHSLLGTRFLNLDGLRGFVLIDKGAGRVQIQALPGGVGTNQIAAVLDELRHRGEVGLQARPASPTWGIACFHRFARVAPEQTRGLISRFGPFFPRFTASLGAHQTFLPSRVYRVEMHFRPGFPGSGDDFAKVSTKVSTRGKGLRFLWSASALPLVWPQILRVGEAGVLFGGGCGGNAWPNEA